MGKVYRAEVHGAVPGLESGSTVALKVIHAHLLDTPGFFQRFLREADIGRSVRHENVVRTHLADALLQEGIQQNFLVMEFVEGQTLRDLQEELARVPEELCRHIGREVAKGLAAIHAAGVVHRDLKPENVLITPDHVVKVMDLGIARLQDEAVRLTRAGAFVGSLEYAAPEQIRAADGEADARADLHALGLLLYELSTGAHPYRDDEVSRLLHKILQEMPRKVGELNPQLSPFFEEVVQTLLAKDRDERFRSASDLARVLDEGESSAWWSDRARAIRVETQRPLRRIRVPRETALYGRDEDLARLQAQFERVKGGEGQVLLVEGEAGIGKTRLVDEFVGRLRQAGEDLNFLFGSYPPGGAGMATGAFSTAYREHLGTEGLESTLGSYLAATPALVPAFASLLRGDGTPRRTESLSREALQTLFVNLTRGLAAERPTIVLIDDLHFAPADARTLFTSLGLAVAEHPILLVGTMRRGMDPKWLANLTRHEQVEQRTLGRMAPDDLFLLLRDAFRSERLARQLAEKLAVKCDGNPFFAFEIIQGLREGQFITQQSDGTWINTQVIEDIEIPSSVTDLIQARLGDLTEEERELLDVAACCGSEFDPGLVARTVGIERLPALRRFGRIERSHHLVRSVGRRYAFDHHQIQESLYGGLHEQMREELHAAIGSALEARERAREIDAAEVDGAICVELARHFLAGARGERAHRYLDRALDHLGRGYVHDVAVDLAESALAAPDLIQGEERGRLLIRIGEANGPLALMGRAEEQRARCEEALLLAREVGHRALEAKALRNLGSALHVLGRNEEAQDAYERDLALTLELGDRREEAVARGNLGLMLQTMGRYAEAREEAERSLAVARELNDKELETRGSGNLGIVLWCLGKFPDAKIEFERQRDVAYEIGDLQQAHNGIASLGVTLSIMGRVEDAKEQIERGLAIAREIGDRPGEIPAHLNLGGALRALGRLPAALEEFELSLSLAREIGSLPSEANAAGNLSNTMWSLGRFAEARLYGERFRALAEELGDPLAESLACGNLGNTAHSLGRFAQAIEECERQLSIAREIELPVGQAQALLNLGSLACEEGRFEEAEALFAESMEIRRALGVQGEVAESLTLRAALLDLVDRPEEARADLEEALEITATHANPGVELLARTRLACLPGGEVEPALRAMEEHGDAADYWYVLEACYLLWRATRNVEHLRAAKERLDHLVQHAPLEDRESMMGNLRLHRDIVEAWAQHHPAHG